jgi:hypothetical protein
LRGLEVTSPYCPSPSKRRGTFWRKPKQGEVRIGGRETAGSTRRATSPCLLRTHPSPSQGEGIATSPYCPSPSKRRGTFWRKPKQGEVRIGGQETTGSTRSEKPHPVCFADIPLLHKGEGIATSPYCPSPSQGEGRFGESRNRVRSG